MEFNDLLYEVRDHVATITINRPEARNAMSAEWMGALRRLIPQLGVDGEVGCVVLTGAGRAFCAGGDVKGMAGGGGGGGRVATLEERIRGLRADQAAISAAIYELGKPVIAALPGPAAGAGLSLALACDLRVMAESAFITTAALSRPARRGATSLASNVWLTNSVVGGRLAQYCANASTEASGATSASFGSSMWSIALTPYVAPIS